MIAFSMLIWIQTRNLTVLYFKDATTGMKMGKAIIMMDTPSRLPPGMPEAG